MFIEKAFSGGDPVPVAKFTLAEDGEMEAGRIDYWFEGSRLSDRVVVGGSATFVASRFDGSSDFAIASQSAAVVDPLGLTVQVVGALSLHVLTFSASLSGDTSGVAGTVALQITPFRGHTIEEA
jgi:hypothetical protein